MNNELKEKIEAMEKAIRCLALEVPQVVYETTQEFWQSLKSSLQREEDGGEEGKDCVASVQTPDEKPVTLGLGSGNSVESSYDSLIKSEGKWYANYFFPKDDSRKQAIEIGVEYGAKWALRFLGTLLVESRKQEKLMTKNEQAQLPSAVEEIKNMIQKLQSIVTPTPDPIRESKGAEEVLRQELIDLWLPIGRRQSDMTRRGHHLNARKLSAEQFYSLVNEFRQSVLQWAVQKFPYTQNSVDKSAKETIKENYEKKYSSQKYEDSIFCKQFESIIVAAMHEYSAQFQNQSPIK